MRQWRAALVAVGIALGWASGAMEVPEAPLFVSMTSADGLPSTYAMALAEDATGYVWIGTQDGLARYDSVEFHTYRHQVCDPDSLPTNSVSPAYRAESLWVGTEGGGSCWMPNAAASAAAPHRPRFALSDVWRSPPIQRRAGWAAMPAGLHRFDTVNDVEVIRRSGWRRLPSTMCWT